VFGKAGAQILEAVGERGSITAAARELKMSYRFTWNYLTRSRKDLHQPVVVTRRGGTPSAKKKDGTLTPFAKVLLKDFTETERLMRQILSRREGTAVT
jgi:molybdate transport system regulatory protein